MVMKICMTHRHMMDIWWNNRKGPLPPFCIHCRPIRWNILSWERYFSFRLTLLVIRWWADTNITMGPWTGMPLMRFNTQSHWFWSSNASVSNVLADARNGQWCQGVSLYHVLMNDVRSKKNSHKKCPNFEWHPAVRRRRLMVRTDGWRPMWRISWALNLGLDRNLLVSIILSKIPSAARPLQDLANSALCDTCDVSNINLSAPFAWEKKNIQWIGWQCILSKPSCVRAGTSIGKLLMHQFHHQLLYWSLSYVTAVNQVCIS